MNGYTYHPLIDTRRMIAPLDNQADAIDAFGDLIDNTIVADNVRRVMLDHLATIQTAQATLVDLANG